MSNMVYNGKSKVIAEIVRRLNQSGGGSNVSITPTLQSGTKIADFEIDEESGELYAPQGGGASNYESLSNLPRINGVTLIGNKSSNDLNLMPSQSFYGEKLLQSMATGGFTELDFTIELDSNDGGLNIVI